MVFVSRLHILTEASAVSLKVWLLQVLLLSELTEGIQIRTTACTCGEFHTEEDVFQVITLDLLQAQEGTLPRSVTDVFKHIWTKRTVLAKEATFCRGHPKRKPCTVQVRASMCFRVRV